MGLFYCKYLFWFICSWSLLRMVVRKRDRNLVILCKFWGLLLEVKIRYKLKYKNMIDKNVRLNKF